jgi:hypothetical protein
MADKLGLASEIRNWLQFIIVAVATTGLGIYAFLYKEIWTPAAAPLNLTMDVIVKEAGFNGAGSSESKEPFEAIELTITARNPSTRDLYLLRNCWYATGLSMLPRKYSEGWIDAVNKRVEQRAWGNDGARYNVQKTGVVAAGSVFKDVGLHPNETISTSFVFLVPQDMYDVLRVEVQLPTIATRDSAEFRWTVTPDQGCDGGLFRKPNGEQISEHDAFLDRTIRYQVAVSTRELSLWQSKAPPAATTKPPGTLPQQ